MRNRIAIILLFASWPVCVIHRYWNNDPITPVSWIILDKTVNQDFRWYWVANELWLSSVFVLLAWKISKCKTRPIRLLINANLIISGVDIVNYWLWFRRNEFMLFLEGFIMLLTIILILKIIPNNEKAT